MLAPQTTSLAIQNTLLPRQYTREQIVLQQPFQQPFLLFGISLDIQVMHSFLSVRQGGGPLLVSHDFFKDGQKGIEANPIDGITSANRHNPCEDGEEPDIL